MLKIQKYSFNILLVTASSTVSGQSGCFGLNSALVVRGVE